MPTKKEEAIKEKKDIATETKEVAEAATGKEPTAKTKKKARKAVPHAKVFVQASYNNTIVTVTDQNGNVISWASSGNCGFKGARKSTPYAAQVAAEKAMEKAESYGITDIDVYIKGVGAGRDQCIRGLVAKGTVNLLSINDKTPIPHGGCRKKKVRRV
jgi:small subunit ribosomal protein S11